jgi:hypothetical protein
MITVGAALLKRLDVIQQALKMNQPGGAFLTAGFH